MKKSFLTSIITLSVLMTSCASNTSKELSFKVISPIGAPSVAFAKYAKDTTNIEIAAQPTAVRAQLVNPNEEYKAVIFDATTGLNLINKTNPDNPGYKLARIITAGNLFVLSTGTKDSSHVMSDDDTILSFGQNNIPDKVFKLIYSDITPDYYANGVAQIAAALKTGQYEGNTIDYVVLSEPYVSQVLNENSFVTVYANVTSQFNAYANKRGYNLNGFPQAGLFIAQSYETDTYKKDVEAFISTVDNTMSDLTKKGSSTVKDMDNFSSDATEQASRFGMNSETLRSLVADNNRLGYKAGYYDLESFYKLLNLDAPQANAYSRYWISK